MAALPPSDVFAVERQRLESAAAELRCLLAEKQQQLSEQCAKCAHEEEKLLRSKYLSEFKEISTQKEAMKEKLKKHMDGLEQQEMDLECAEERKKTVAEYQSRLQTESSRNDLLARISQLKAKQRGATEALKSQMSHVMKTHQAEEAKLSQQLRLREEDFARNEEECATSNAQGMTLQEHLAADLKHQLSASQEKVATFEVSLESMQALILQKEMKVEEMIQSCDIGLKQKAAERDFSEKEKSELKEREKSLEAATRQMKRLDEAESLTKDLENQLKTSGFGLRVWKKVMLFEDEGDKRVRLEWLEYKIQGTGVRVQGLYSCFRVCRFGRPGHGGDQRSSLSRQGTFKSCQ